MFTLSLGVFLGHATARKCVTKIIGKKDKRKYIKIYDDMI